jgi:hypothetical protein
VSLNIVNVRVIIGELEFRIGSLSLLDHINRSEDIPKDLLKVQDDLLSHIIKYFRIEHFGVFLRDYSAETQKNGQTLTALIPDENDGEDSELSDEITASSATFQQLVSVPDACIRIIVKSQENLAPENVSDTSSDSLVISEISINGIIDQVTAISSTVEIESVIKLLTNDGPVRNSTSESEKTFHVSLQLEKSVFIFSKESIPKTDDDFNLIIRGSERPPPSLVETPHLRISLDSVTLDARQISDNIGGSILKAQISEIQLAEFSPAKMTYNHVIQPIHCEQVTGNDIFTTFRSGPNVIVKKSQPYSVTVQTTRKENGLQTSFYTIKTPAIQLDLKSKFFATWSQYGIKLPKSEAQSASKLTSLTLRSPHIRAKFEIGASKNGTLLYPVFDVGGIELKVTPTSASFTNLDSSELQHQNHISLHVTTFTAGFLFNDVITNSVLLQNFGLKTSGETPSVTEKSCNMQHKLSRQKKEDKKDWFDFTKDQTPNSSPVSQASNISSEPPAVTFY